MTKEFLDGACSKCGGSGDLRAVNPQWLRERRKKASRTLREIAGQLGFSAAYICDIEHGRRAVSAKVHDVYRALKANSK